MSHRPELCACGKVGLRRVGKEVFCKAHTAEAFAAGKRTAVSAGDVHFDAQLYEHHAKMQGEGRR